MNSAIKRKKIDEITSDRRKCIIPFIDPRGSLYNDPRSGQKTRVRHASVRLLHWSIHLMVLPSYKCMVGQKSKILRTRTAWGRTPVQATPLAAGIPPCHHRIRLASPPPARFMCGMCQHGGRRCAQRTEEGPSPRRVRPLRLHAARAAPASRLATAAFHLHLTALRACCGCTPLLELMRRAHMRVPAEACEGAAGTHDPAAGVASSASAVARVSCRMAAAARVPPASSP